MSTGVCSMSVRLGFALVAAVLATTAAFGAAGSATRVVDLRCEFAADPLGVDLANPRLQWRIESTERGAKQTAYQVIVASSAELLSNDTGDLWDSGRIQSDQTTHLRYAGAPLRSSQRVFWKARSWDQGGVPTGWSPPASWTMGLLDPADWKARWVAAPWASESVLLRREFAVRAGLRRALLHVCGLGHYEPFVNGAKAGSDLFSPGWTDYNTTTLYETRDVTPMLREGTNALGLTLGNGMYNVVRRDRFAKFTGSFGPLRAIAQLELEYEDGDKVVVGTDNSWRVNRGAVTYNSIYGGEDHDARLLPKGWNRAGFDDRSWDAAVELVRPPGTLRSHSHSAEPLRIIETRKPVSTRKPGAGVELFDFGQNASFMPRLRVRGPRGSIVRMTPGEVVNEDGTIARGTLGGAHRGGAWWQYTKATDGEEEWFPQFYYVGSRYLFVERFPAGVTPGSRLATESIPAGGRRYVPPEKGPEVLPEIVSVEQNIVHSVAAPVGTFATSNPLLNRIRDLVRWAQRSNMVSVLTDCPHREKLGWIEQYHLNGPSIRYEFDVARIFTKGMHDMATAQTADGLIPNITPEYTEFKGAFRGAAEWGAAFILVPWQQYQFTGDIDLLRTHYDAMKRYFAYLETRAKDNILSDGLGDWYDYAPGTGKRANLTPAPITATAFFFHDAQMLAQIATLLGQDEDARRFAQRAGEIRSSYIKAFRRPNDGLYGTASQASLAIPLVMGLVEEADRAKVTAALVRDLEEKGYASAGDVAFRYLLRALADAGRSDVVYAFINQDQKPGYGYQLKQGATALAESWHASLDASHNHFMLGQVIEWYYHDLVGIAPDVTAPGFKRTIIRPHPVGDLTWAEASHASIHGPIHVRWQRSGDGLKLRLTIPPNAGATVFVPADDGTTVTESEVSAEKSSGVTFLRREGDRAVYEVESGTYEFSSTWHPPRH